MFQHPFSAADLATVNNHQFGDISGRLDKAAQMGAYPGQARKLAEAFLGEFHRRLVGQLPDIGASRASQNHGGDLGLAAILGQSLSSLKKIYRIGLDLV
jgi:hypothetical protein